ncbi:hypothetical protein B0H63DRAFT_307221 [Podospora didyma]|uniref:Uncharacterized protein n=1 Tax=Podospora didyma TaxID=330526 RepID=A0AAE0N5E8_9PEZI|nr:hypothetical protein B0H63DRAFT_307221 [Podospora didyma]
MPAPSRTLRPLLHVWWTPGIKSLGLAHPVPSIYSSIQGTHQTSSLPFSIKHPLAHLQLGLFLTSSSQRQQHTIHNVSLQHDINHFYNCVARASLPAQPSSPCLPTDPRCLTAPPPPRLLRQPTPPQTQTSPWTGQFKLPSSGA